MTATVDCSFLPSFCVVLFALPCSFSDTSSFCVLPLLAKINETDTFGPGDDEDIQFDDIGDDDEDIDDVGAKSIFVLLSGSFNLEVYFEFPLFVFLLSPSLPSDLRIFSKRVWFDFSPPRQKSTHPKINTGLLYPTHTHTPNFKEVDPPNFSLIP